MEEKAFKTLDELFAINHQVKSFFKIIKDQFKLNFEEIYILNILNNCNGYEVTAKEIAQKTNLKPYYITKALQKLKDMGYLDKKRSEHDERTVIVFISHQEKAKIEFTINALNKHFY
ncbi:MarR family transcriptional regulator [Staphylococcus lloydii]|uniref:transcriptional regulator, SarA/Rot family n=1 Tax=Staphylococcus lloydii TaxID=2781774 RepID=UPI00292915F4|nr:MarR family transcriptional regulator [Staphylococcus lloydii]MDU9418228.1 MarR family transcriptional regulator [Staphylococcus lloydii]